MKRLLACLLFAVALFRSGALLAQDADDLSTYGVPPNPGFATDCFWDQPRHGPGSEQCTFPAVTPLQQIEDYYKAGFRRRGWQLQARHQDQRSTATFVTMVWVRLDCGQDYPLRDLTLSIGRAAEVTISWNPSFRNESYVSYFEGLQGQFEQYRTDTACEVFAIARARGVSRKEKERRLRVVQKNVGVQAFAAAVRLIPVYDRDANDGAGGVVTLDTSLRATGKSIDPTGNGPMHEDPIGAMISMVVDPSLDNIGRNTGLPSPPQGKH